MTSCDRFDPLLAELASGAVPAADAALLDAHLEGCARCRAELDAYRGAFGMARLPAPTEEERRALAGLPTRALAELRRDRVGTPIWRAFAVGFLAAAVIAAVIAAPTQVSAPASHAEAGAETAAAEWQEPDPDELLDAATFAAPASAAAEESDEPLVPAERLADAAWDRAFHTAE